MVNPPSSLLRTARRLAGLSQRALAERAGRCQSVVANIERGWTSPSWKTLEQLLAAAGFEIRATLRDRAEAARRRRDPVIEAYGRDLDRTLLRRNLRRSPEERIVAAMELQRVADEVRRAGREARGR
jgi:transcriptional regulator with XRE-family HTH domain